MLIRVYRLTDRFSLAAMKLTAAAADWLLDGASGLVSLFSRGSGGIIGAVLAVIVGILRLIGRAFSLIWNIVLTLLRLIRDALLTIFRLLARAATGFLGLLGFLGARAGTAAVRAAGATGQSVGDSASRNMARRRARAEMDVRIVEDPLRVQNRLLSVLVLLLGAAVIAVVLWATDPSRNSAPSIAGAGSSLFDSLGTATPDAESQSVVSIQSTPIPTATSLPAALQSSGTIAYVVRERSQQDLWAVGIGSRRPVRLTNDPADERDPAWAPDGLQLAYASRKSGNWEIYIQDVANLDIEARQITFDLSFQGGPQWSPDGLWLIYESYQGGNMDIYAALVDGSQPPQRLTDHPEPDFSPAWSPLLREVAFVSWRDGNQDIYIFNLDTLEVTNLTRTPDRNEDHPAWSPDGRQLAYSAVDQGREKVFVMDMTDPGAPPRTLSIGRAPSWSPDGVSLTFAADSENGQAAFLYAFPYEVEGIAAEVIDVPYGTSDPSWTGEVLPQQLVNSGGLALSAADLYIEQETRFQGSAPYKLNPLFDIQPEGSVLSDRVNDSFNALRARVIEEAGWDFLELLEDAWWDLNRRPPPGAERRDWHMTGRAFSFSKSRILGFPPAVEMVREDDSLGNTYWRIYIRVAEEAQSGQFGEPLRKLPWDLLSRNLGDVEAYNQGGRLRLAVPTGYYIDFTQLAADYGWGRIPAGQSWRANADLVYYWVFEKRDGLDWYSAMSEIYTQGELVNFAPTATPGPRSAEGAGS